MSNIIDLLTEYGVPFVGEEHHHGRPNWVQIDCPSCGPGSGKFHLGISLVTGASSCWKCGGQSTAWVLSTVTRKPRSTVQARLSSLQMNAPVIEKTGTLSIPNGVVDMTAGHKHYLKSRGFDPDTIEKLWGVRGIAHAGSLSWRLFIPIQHFGATVSWTTRSINPNEKQRWISASTKNESIQHKHILYGADYAHHVIIIHEGPTDVWATGPGAIATCGTGYTGAQLRAMARYPLRVVCFDAEGAAQARARELANALSAFPGKTHNVVLETGTDPADADPKEIAKLRATFLE